MTQAELELLEPVKVPDASTQCGVLLRALKNGERLTVATALSRYGVYALSQRLGELRRNGWPIQSRSVEVKPAHGSRPATRVSEYWLTT
jgi:hypothetical protein